MHLVKSEDFVKIRQIKLLTKSGGNCSNGSLKKLVRVSQKSDLPSLFSAPTVKPVGSFFVTYS